jgi:acyl carrier protein
MNAPIPQGIEVLVKKASVDAQFRELLLTRPTEAAGQIGLALTAAESLMLAAVPRGQLEAIIAQVSVPQEHRRAFLGKAAAAMLAALGVGGGMALGGQPTRGTRPSDPGTFGLQPDLPNAPPPKNPAEKPADDKDKAKEEELRKQVTAIIAKQLHTAESQVTDERSLADDLGATTSTLVKLRKALEKKFKVKLPGKEFKKVRTVGDVVGVVRAAVKEKAAAANPRPPAQPPAQQPQTPMPEPSVGGIRPY